MKHSHNTHNQTNHVEKENLTMKHAKNIGTIALTATLALSLAAPAAAADYTVRKGDSLWKIAQEQLGSGRRWTDIHAANRDTVKNPDMIQIGQVLHIPGEAQATTQPEQSQPATAAPNPQPEQAPAAVELTQTEKALALINTFDSGDTAAARELLAEGYIQHNLAYGTGRDAFLGSVEYLASAPVKTTVNNIRAFEDGDKVFLQTIYNFAGAGEQVAFDIFRFDAEGKIAEHWDNLATLAEPNPSGHTQTDGTMAVTDLDKTEANRKLVQSFLYDVMQGNNLEKTPDYFDGDTYIQHNTGIADGVSGLNAALAALAEQGIAMVYDEVHQVLAQGNFVLAVSEGTFGGAPTAYYDLWRVEDGKIAEHWDVMETIAERSTWTNENGKF